MILLVWSIEILDVYSFYGPDFQVEFATKQNSIYTGRINYEDVL